MAFCAAVRSWPSQGDRLSPRRSDLFQGEGFVRGLAALEAAASAGRSEDSLSMKVQKVRKNPAKKSNSSTRRRRGPRTDVEGYSAEAFGEHCECLGVVWCV